mmetsp:Transcript_41817/g.104571  ORF Transcript_41817/g.104571 Transcript_41817/m.104571 type:complete len:304 (+) Transcript_41817:232-1143(+)|eukprot:CAMPEP_0173441824 /NCGR_PEP_ID=MMETSP1357-20121228/24165_1 /TAXON_ID=77926 /ORGANISM="Hemiselmis rufescens, Strain PCC563" /LENGTH=303 /DNA_ID=CAMNT_0014407431 /DNA_START=134 /DNA_END=1045 /DNA_ORIENTATION=+
MTSLLASEEAALVSIQCAARGKMARQERKRLEADREEEKVWRLSLSRRRERIERLERELHLVEEMPAAQVDHYASTARYGRSNTNAAARTIQGIFRFVIRVKQRKLAKDKKRDAAARVLQRMFRNQQVASEDKPKKKGDKEKSPSEAKEEKDAAARRAADDMAGELPSVARVAELQALVVKRLEERKRERGFARTQDSELRELAERAKTSMEGYRESVTDARLAMIERYKVRGDTAALFTSLWGCHDLASMMADARLQTSATGGTLVALPLASREHTALLMQIAKNEHGEMLRSLSGDAVLAR